MVLRFRLFVSTGLFTTAVFLPESFVTREVGNTTVAQTALGCPFVVQLLSHVRLFATAWTAARQASPSFTFSWSLLKFMSIESVMPSNHLTLCRPLLFLSSMFPNESVLPIRWPKYWSFSISISPYSEYSGLISFKTVPWVGTKSFLSFSFIFWVISTEGFILNSQGPLLFPTLS